MIDDGTRLLVRRDDFSDNVALCLMQKSDTGVRAVATSVTMQTLEPGKYVEPTFRLSHTAAQALMDELWTCGFRPSEGSGSAGALKAVENHLSDMRKLVGVLIQRDGKTPEGFEATW